MTMPEPDEPRDAQPLGSETAPPGDPESQGGTPGPADGVAGLMRLAEQFGDRQVFDLIRLCRLDAGPGKRAGAEAGTTLAQRMVQQHMETKNVDYDTARAAVATELGYTPTTRTNFYKILTGTPRRALGRGRAGQ